MADQETRMRELSDAIRNIPPLRSFQGCEHCHWNQLVDQRKWYLLVTLDLSFDLIDILLQFIVALITPRMLESI